jgi:hypothetical protein
MHLYPNQWGLVNHNWGFRQVVISLQYMQNPKSKDIWFSIFISAILAYLRLVGDTSGFKAERKPVVNSSKHRFIKMSFTFTVSVLLRASIFCRYKAEICDGLITGPAFWVRCI